MKKFDLEILKISSCEFKKIILERFKGKIFHITNEENYHEIIKSNAILATNNIKNVKNIWGSQKNMSYFRMKNCISVCDLFHNNDNKLIVKAMEEYRFYNPSMVVNENIAYYLILSKNIYKECVTWSSLDKDEVLGHKIVSNLESGIPDRILLSDITHVIKVITDEQPISELEQYYSTLLKEQK